MGIVIVPYTDGAGTKMGVSTDADQQSFLDDYITASGIAGRVGPYGLQFATLAALQAWSEGAWSDAIAAPPGLTPRKIQFGVGDNTDDNTPGVGLATIQAVVGDIASFNLLEPTGETPFPVAAQQLTLVQAQITATSGESRSSN